MNGLATLVDLLREWRERGNEQAIIAFGGDNTDTWTYGGLADQAFRIACHLVAAGVSRQDPVAILAPNSPRWIAAYFGIVAAGATAVPLDWHISSEDLELVLSRVGCRRLFTPGERLSNLPEAWIEGAHAIYLMDKAEAGITKAVHWKELMQKTDITSLPSIDADARASLLFTSGTTGTPKAVPLSHRNFMSNVKALLEERIISRTDRLLLPLPLHHAYPFTVGMLSALASGATLVLPRGTTGPLILEAVRSAKVTAMLGVPGLYQALLRSIESNISRRSWLSRAFFNTLLTASVWARRHLGLPIGRVVFSGLHESFGGNLRILASGGAKLDEELAWKLEGLGWQVLSGYGLTETSPILTFNPPRRKRLNSEGLPIPHVKLRVQQAADESYGEVLAFGPSVFSGYLDDPEANARAFAESGWFRTGDLGYLDDAGYLHIVGRANETLVLSSGKKIFPEDIEKHYQGIDYIKELAIFLLNQQLVALVVPDAEAIRIRGASRVERLLREEIERASAKFRSYERLSDFAVTLEALPRTQLGKIKRHRLPALFKGAKTGKVPPQHKELSTEDAALLSRPETRTVWEWLSTRYADRPITPDTSPQLDLGIDSLQWIELTLELQDRFNIRLSEEAIGRILSIRDLLNEVIQHRASATPIERVDLSQWVAPLRYRDKLFGLLLYGLGFVLARLVFRLQVRGKELIPSESRVVLTPNHSSYLDPVVLAACFSWAELSKTYWVGWSRIMLGGPVMRAVSRAFRVLPIDPDRAAGEALDLARLALQRGSRLVWFPEGRLSPTGEITTFLPGIALVLEQTGATAVPAHISGTFQALPRTRLLPRPHKVIVTFGKPVGAEELEQNGVGPNQHSRIADALRKTVSRLAP